MIKTLRRLRTAVTELFGKHRALLPVTIGITLVGAIYLIGKTQDSHTVVVRDSGKSSLAGGRSIGSGESVYQRKSNLLERRMKLLETSQKEIKDAVEKLASAPEEGSDDDANRIRSYPSNVEITTQTIPPPAQPYPQPSNLPRRGQTRPVAGPEHGPDIISFPIKSSDQVAAMGVSLPSGSFVKARLLTGVEAPEGKALPVLLQADYAFVGPNKTRVDLAGCFLIAKSRGNLSIERVEMQASKMSCVSKSGRMFERDINGFIADDKDNSFAVIGNVNSKQDRVAAMAFLSSVVEGIGKAITQAQTAQTQGSEGQVSTNVTGDTARFALAGGATNAAAMVSQWYLKQAQSLLPTINVGSGQAVWIVMQEGVNLPSWYFHTLKGAKDHVFSYFSSIMD